MPRNRVQLRPESLETREVPAAGLLETFDQTAPPALPTGWLESSNDGSNVFDTAAGKGTGSTIGLVATGTSRTSGLAWNTTAVPGDTSAATLVKLDSLIPTFVFTRGSNLVGSQPTYLAATITRGVSVSVTEVVNGVPRLLGSVTSPSSAYFSGNWVKVVLAPTGSSVAVQVIRQDTGQYLTPQGTWQAAATSALTVQTTIASADGLAGVGRGAAYSGSVSVDNFETTPPAPPAPPPPVGVVESFDTTPAGSKPAGWSGWSSDAGSAFAASTARAETPTNGFASNGGSTSAARAWSDTDLPADVNASAALYLDSIIPAQLIVRGANLNTSNPSYYAITVTRGLQASLVKVVNGTATTLGSIKSNSYFSSAWLRVSLVAEGDRLRVLLYRPDTRQWLGSDGNWTDSPDFAIEKQDGAIAAGGKAGVGRAAQYSGAITFDDFHAEPATASSGPDIAIKADQNNTVTGDVTFTATASGTITRIEFRVNGLLRATAAVSPAVWTFDSTTVTNGTYTLTVRAFDAAGNFSSQDYSFTVSNPNMDPVPKPTIPQHYSWIRVAELAYGGTPITNAFEQNLLKNSIDLVVPNTAYLNAIQSTSPNTPQLIYSNVSNLYQGLLADWIDYARRNGIDSELAFYHVTQATPWTGASPSSQPVTWFWSAYQSTGSTVTDVTAAIRGGRNFNVNFGGTGTWTAIGNLDKFREMNVTLATAAGAGWSGTWEYPSAVDANGNPTAWKPLALIADGTKGMTSSGTITFDPPSDWKATSIGGSSREFYVRLRATAGTTANAPQLATLFGRDYVRANGGNSGVIPAFDYAADKDHDGYLNDAEYASRAAGKDARFVYESRLFYPYYGQERFVTNPSASAVRKWAADYHVRLLNATPVADGIFMDNAHGKLPFAGTPVLEPTATYSSDSGALVAAVNRAIAPRWVMANTAGGTTEGDAIAAGSAAVIEEFLLRPLDSNWSEVGDAANLVAERLNTTGSPYVVLDSLPTGGSPTDGRTQLATLAYYYLVGDPNRSMLMFYGGYSPSTSWTQHWSPAVTVNVGKPTGSMQLFATGKDPLSPSLTYKVFSRTYENGLVLYKPLSYAQGVGSGTLNDGTATTHALGGNYRRVNADGTLGPVISSITLRNGEGAVLIKA
jgi:hypothetical protein